MAQTLSLETLAVWSALAWSGPVPLSVRAQSAAGIYQGPDVFWSEGRLAELRGRVWSAGERAAFIGEGSGLAVRRCWSQSAGLRWLEWCTHQAERGGDCWVSPATGQVVMGFDGRLSQCALGCDGRAFGDLPAAAALASRWPNASVAEWSRSPGLYDNAGGSEAEACVRAVLESGDDFRLADKYAAQTEAQLAEYMAR